MSTRKSSKGRNLELTRCNAFVKRARPTRAHVAGVAPPEPERQEPARDMTMLEIALLFKARRSRALLFGDEAEVTLAKLEPAQSLVPKTNALSIRQQGLLKQAAS